MWLFCFGRYQEIWRYFDYIQVTLSPKRASSEENPYYDPNKTHHTPEGFTNPEPNEHRSGDLKRWQNERKKNRLPLKPEQGYRGLVERWWQQVDLEQSQDGVWWLGHAAMLVKWGAKRS